MINDRFFIMLFSPFGVHFISNNTPTMVNGEYQLAGVYLDSRIPTYIKPRLFVTKTSYPSGCRLLPTQRERGFSLWRVKKFHILRIRNVSKYVFVYSIIFSPASRLYAPTMQPIHMIYEGDFASKCEAVRFRTS